MFEKHAIRDKKQNQKNIFSFFSNLVFKALAKFPIYNVRVKINNVFKK